MDVYISSPSHATIILGGPGIGKSSIANYLVNQVLGENAEKAINNAHLLHIKPEKNVITIEQVRGAQDFVRLKTAGSNQIRRAIIVEQAQTMTTEAQNAFLKLLEEPPEDTIIILTANSKDNLLPTIVSRAQKLVVRPPKKYDIEQHFSVKHSLPDVTKAYLLSKGHPGLMEDILTGANEGEMTKYIDMAKQLIVSKPFERLVIVDQFSKKKDDIPGLLWALLRVSDAAMQQAAAKDNTKVVQYWVNVQKQVLQAQDSLPANPQPKLLLTNLALHL
jgi:DNA polymerase-3 subunit delta'